MASPHRLAAAASCWSRSRRLLPVAHPHRGDGDAGRHQQHHDGRERVDVRRHAEAHLREDHHGQRARSGSGHELRDDQIIPRQREGQQPPGGDRRQDERQRDRAGTPCAGRAPRSMAASSSDSSNPARRDCTTTVTYAMQKVMCASVIVTAPTPCGQPISCSSGDEQQQQRQAGDHLRHDDGGGNHAGEQQPSAERAEARQRHAGERAEHHRSARRDQRNADRQPRGAQDLLVVQQRHVPPERRRVRRVPHRDEARVVEGEHDHRDDRHVQEHQPENQRAAREQAARLHRVASELAPLEALEQQDRHHQQQQDQDRHRARHRPVAILEELVRQHPPDHQLVGAPEQRRDHVLADRRDEHQQRAGDDTRAATAAA